MGCARSRFGYELRDSAFARSSPNSSPPPVDLASQAGNPGVPCPDAGRQATSCTRLARQVVLPRTNSSPLQHILDCKFHSPDAHSCIARTCAGASRVARGPRDIRAQPALHSGERRRAHLPSAASHPQWKSRGLRIAWTLVSGLRTGCTARPRPARAGACGAPPHRHHQGFPTAACPAGSGPQPLGTSLAP